MPQGLSRLRLGFVLAVVLALFCFPLFLGLGGPDLDNDEAIYSFAVDRILEAGDWLTPKSTPYEDRAFLEKPPLKMWVVAAPIRAGLLPLDEFGLRFWDAVFGGAVFVYAFLIGRRLSGALGGLAAALVLFVHWPLIFEHGLRSNNMEAALTLCYCGGVYHFLAWSTSATPRRRRLETLAVGACFVLGFMTKFVAAAFLPIVLGAAVLLVPPYRSALVRDRRLWLGAGAVAAVLIVPWFVYANITYGMLFWRIIFGQHIYQRFASVLDPAHLHPWHYYVTEMFDWFGRSGSRTLVAGGFLWLAAQSTWRRRPEPTTVLLWGALPLALISAGTSKLYHYAYPFLPALAIGGGCFIAFLADFAQPWAEMVLRTCGRFDVRRRWLRMAAVASAATAFAVAAVTIVHGPISISVGGVTLLSNAGLLRPLMAGIILGGVAGHARLVSRMTILVVALLVLPWPQYRDVLAELSVSTHPVRSASRCVNEIERGQAPPGGQPAGLYVDAADRDVSHSQYYYFRRIRPWIRADAPGSSRIVEYLDNRGLQRPVLISYERYQDLLSRRVIESQPFVRFEVNSLLLVLPGSYASCSLGDRRTAGS